MFVSTDAKWKTKPDSTQYQCQNAAAVSHDESHTVDCLQIRSEERAPERGSQELKSSDSNRRTSSSSKGNGAESRDALHSGAGGAESTPTSENLPQEEQGSKATRATKNSSPKARRANTNTPSPPAGRTEKKQRSSSKTLSPNRDKGHVADKTPAPPSHHTEHMSK